MIKTLQFLSVNNLNYSFSKCFHLGIRASFMNVRDPSVEKKSAEVTVVHENIFDRMKEKNKKAFYGALDLYITKNNIHRFGKVKLFI